MIDILISGLAGAIVGAVVVWYVSHREQVNLAKQRLRILLLSNGYEIWYGGKREPWQVVEANRIEVHAAYLNLRASMLFWSLKPVNKAWKEYTGVEHYNDMRDDDPSKIFAKSAVTRDHAVARTIALLKITN